jgi:hypothetical protein
MHLFKNHATLINAFAFVQFREYRAGNERCVPMIDILLRLNAKGGRKTMPSTCRVCRIALLHMGRFVKITERVQQVGCVAATRGFGRHGYLVEKPRGTLPSWPSLD